MIFKNNDTLPLLLLELIVDTFIQKKLNRSELIKTDQL